MTLRTDVLVLDKVIEMNFLRDAQAQRAKALIESADIPFVVLVGIHREQYARETAMHIVLAEMNNPDDIYDVIGRIYVALSVDETVGLMPRLDI